jgi:hypothetical protein
MRLDELVVDVHAVLHFLAVHLGKRLLKLVLLDAQTARLREGHATRVGHLAQTLQELPGEGWMGE